MSIFINDDQSSLLQSGKERIAPTFSNINDCVRFKCPPTPWNWATNWVLEKASFSGNEIICDLGAGFNPIAIDSYKRKVQKAYLVDNLIQPSCELVSTNIQFILADITCLPFENESIDIVVSISVFEHLEKVKRIETIKEIKRVLKPKGKAIISLGYFFNVNSEAEILLKQLPFFRERGCMVYLPINVKDTIDIFEGFSLMDADGLEMFPGYSEFNEKKTLSLPGLVTEKFIDYPELVKHSPLKSILVSEIGLIFIKDQF